MFIYLLVVVSLVGTCSIFFLSTLCNSCWDITSVVQLLRSRLLLSFCLCTGVRCVQRWQWAWHCRAAQPTCREFRLAWSPRLFSPVCFFRETKKNHRRGYWVWSNCLLCLLNQVFYLLTVQESIYLFISCCCPAGHSSPLNFCKWVRGGL